MRQAPRTPRFPKSPLMRSPSTKKKKSLWQFLEPSTRLEGVPIQARTRQNGAKQQAPRDVTAAASTVITSRIALDRIAEGPGAFPKRPSSNAFSARAITSCATVHRYSQPKKQLCAQEKPERRSHRSNLQPPRLVPWRPMSPVGP